MLETELKKLNGHLEKLITAIEALAPAGNALYELNATLETQEITAAPEKKSVSEIVEEHSQKLKDEEPEPEPEVEGESFTTDNIKSMALAISRKDRSKQRDIKAKLAEHDAKIASDLKGDGLQQVGEWLRDLKEELGA